MTAAQKIVDEWLEDGYKPGMTADELYQGYTSFGEDPYTVSDGPDCKFSRGSMPRNGAGRWRQKTRRETPERRPR